MDDRVCGYLAEVQKLGHPSNYQIWKIKMKHVLLLANLWDIVDPLQEIPSDKKIKLTPVEASIEESRKALAMAILQSAVNHPTKSFISHIKEPRECWTVLQNHFAPNTIARKFYLYRRLLTLKMKEGEKFDSFFDRFTQLKCDLEDMGKLFEEEDLVFIILQALPRSWHEFTRRCVMTENFKELTLFELCRKVRSEEQWSGILAKLNDVKKLSL
jgi:hypothetical protein